MKRICLALLMTVLLIPTIAMAKKATVFWISAPESLMDNRHLYLHRVLELALQKTAATYGPYRLRTVPISANSKRLERMVEQGVFPNLFIRFSASDARLERLKAVPFPVDLGTTGYRVAFVSKITGVRLTGVRSLQQLKKFSVVQGAGWLDNQILKANGFKVIEGKSYESMFRMVAKNRSELFLRGANELFAEWDLRSNIQDLTYDKTFVLYYPLPRFFFTTKGNLRNARRVYEGLVAAFEDGSLQRIWNWYYGPSLKFLHLDKRRLFSIPNPYLKTIDRSYERFIYQPKGIK